MAGVRGVGRGAQFDWSFLIHAQTKIRSIILYLSTLSEQRDYLYGVVLLLVVVFLWTTSNFVTQALFQGGYDKPFLVTYLNTSAFAVYLIPYFWRRSTISKDGSHRSANPSEESSEPLLTETLTDTQPRATSEAYPPLTAKETINLAFTFCFLWFIANWTVNAALKYTSVASATILSSMSGFFTLGIGRLFHVESLTMMKIFAVLMSFGGVMLVSISDSSPSSPTVESAANPQAYLAIVGDMLALLSALFYAFYVILLKVRIQMESRVDMQLFFGFVGLFNILTCWIIGVFLHIMDIETFELPSTSNAIRGVLLNMFITLTSDYLYLLSMLKTTPLVVTVGLSLTIPLAVVGDMLLQRMPTLKVVIGALLVVTSFIVVGSAE